MNQIIDASMATAGLFGDEHTPTGLAAFRAVAQSGAFVPSPWRLEVGNVLRAPTRRGRCDEAFVERSLLRLDRLPIRIDDQTDARAWTDARVLSRDENLTVYDAAYLELALRRSVPLASYDIDLARAGQWRGVEIFIA